MTLFRFICELCRQTKIDRTQSKKQLKRLLELYVRPGTIIYIADQNPVDSSPSQPEIVNKFVEELFVNVHWDKLAFYGFDRDLRKLQQKHNSPGPFFNELHDSDCFETKV